MPEGSASCHHPITIVYLKMSKTESSLAKVRHDIRAPICNLRSYIAEIVYLNESLDKLKKEGILSEENKVEFSEIVDTELRICTGALQRATDTLENQVDSLLESYAESLKQP